MLYELLGRAIWVIVRGYVRQRFPHARRNLTIAGIAGVALGAGVALASQRRGAGD
jgi:hypothetical protein